MTVVCMTGSPAIRQAPPSSMTVQQGETVVIECEAIGVPTPLIIWRLNWGHIGDPPRVTTTNNNGRGVLTIRQVGTRKGVRVN